MKSGLMMTLAICGSTALLAQETLTPLENGTAPQTFEALWAGFDPRAEPLDVEVLKEWEQDGVVMRVLRYRVGIFKGQKAMMAAVYGYPEGGSKLPGLVQIHGGGQFAQFEAVLSNAKRGYATISIAWAGRLTAPDYHVDPSVVKLFWEGKTNEPRYRITTDWGAVDGYHEPCRHPGNNFNLNPPSELSLDPVASPRNSGWFLATVAARRALTFLEQQPEVDPDRLGIYGFSKGGKISVLTAGTDKRVKAAAPACGGISDRSKPSALYRATLGDDVYLKNITCPIVFLSPANDFHGRINDLQTAVKEIKSTDWRVICAAHHNHQDNAESEVAAQLWFDQFLKATFTFPRTPDTELILKTPDGIPTLTVRPDASKTIERVDVFYTLQGEIDGKPGDHFNTIARFWHHAAAAKKGDRWIASLPLHSTDKPLWVYANVVYRLDPPVSAVGYYYRAYTADRFNLSSPMQMIAVEELKTAGVKATLQPSLLIESFDGDWEMEWFTFHPADWARSTRKLYSELWKAPTGARLAIDVRVSGYEKNPEWVSLADLPKKLAMGLDGYAAEVDIQGGSDWQTVSLSPSDFLNAVGKPLKDWSSIKEFRLGAKDILQGPPIRQAGRDWEGPIPQFRNLRWVVNP